MSDSEHSHSDIEPAPKSSPRQRRAPLSLDDMDDSADEAPSPRVKDEPESAGRDDRSRERRRRDDDDDPDAYDDDISPRRGKKASPSSRKRKANDLSDDEYDEGDNDDDDNDRPARKAGRKPRVKSERYSDDEDDDRRDADRGKGARRYDDDGDDDDDGDEIRERGNKRKRVKKEGGSRKSLPDHRGHADYGDDVGAGEEGDEDDGEGSGRKRKREMNAMERAIEETKSFRRPRKKEVDITTVENECIVFLERMMKARDDDLRAYRAGRPPLEKIKMLREVEYMMTKVAHREYLLDNMMLPVFKAWLDRLPDGALPNIDVRTTLLRILSDCRVDEDWLQRLEESQGLGKVIHFLSRSDDHEPNRRLAQKLMQKWARVVYRSNSNFHDLQDEFDKPEDGHKAGKDSVAAERTAALRAVRNFKTTQERMRAFKHKEKTGKTESDMMAAIPRATPFLFTTMAEGSHDVDERSAREMRTQKSRTRRVNSTLANLRRMNKSNGARAARPSLNGR